MAVPVHIPTERIIGSKGTDSSSWSFNWSLKTGAPSPSGHGPIAAHGLWGTGLHSRRRAVSKRAKLHLYLQSLPIACITTWAPPPVGAVAPLDSYRSWNSAVSCACEESSLCAPYGNLMPDDLIHIMVRWIIISSYVIIYIMPHISFYYRLCNNNRNKVHSKYNGIESC